jgi:peptide/nickel transport system permease protein
VRRLVALRVLALVAVLFALSIAVFVIRAVLPSDPIRAMVGATAPAEVVERVRSELGYDQPLPVQYARFVTAALQGDLGTSLRTRRPVTEDIARFAPATVELAAATIVIALALAIFMGTWAAAGRRGGGTIRVLMTGSASAPTFAIALLLLVLFYRTLGWFPPGGRLSDDVDPDGPTGLHVIDALVQLDAVKLVDALWHLTLPALCLALIPAVAVGRVLHSSLSRELEQDHISTARAKGLGRWSIVRHHGMRNAAGPAISMAGLQFAALLTGVVIIEQIMAWPGLGRYASQAIGVSDFPAITGVVLVLGVAYVAVNMIVDILHLLADPRLRAHELEA